MSWVNHIKQFLHSKYFADGIKMTIGVLLPSFVLYQFNLVSIGITISLGALCVAIVDNPGPVIHRRNAMLVTVFLIFISALVTGLLNHSVIWLAVEIALFSFFFSMFNVYGLRASSVGTATLLIMILGIDQPMSLLLTVQNALLVMAGGVWYTSLSLSLSEIWPFRAAQQAIGECILQVSSYMRIKAKFYNLGTDIDKDHHELIDQQILVNQQLDFVREILFRTRISLKDNSPINNQFILTFVDVVDLFEQTTASHYDYKLIRHHFEKHKVLHRFEQVIVQMSQELRGIGMAFHNNEKLKPIHHFEPRLNILKRHVDELEKQHINVIVLKKILINLRNIGWRIERIYAYQEQEYPQQINNPSKGLDLNRFINHQQLDWRIFRDNLNLKSANFRHAFRVSIVCLGTFLLAQYLFKGHHSYWILLTVLVILKPSFGLTKQRNYERVIGTLAGGLMGAVILYFVKDAALRFSLLLGFMLLSYSFMRLKYIVSVFFLTPFILILFSFLGENTSTIAQERIIDTLIGAAIASLGSYFLFPNWDSHQLKKMMAEMVLSNAKYLHKALERRPIDAISTSEYRLARKAMYVAQANLSSTFQRMISEPKDRQQSTSTTHKYVVLSHMISSYIASISEFLATEKPALSENQARTLRKIMHTFKETYLQLGTETWPLHEIKFETNPDNEDQTLSEILDIILQTAQDLRGKI